MSKLVFAMVIVIASTGLSVGKAQTTQPPRHDMQTAARFIDTTTGSWSMLETPQLTHRPDVASLAKQRPAYSTNDFGLSFNCAIRRNGSLNDCRTLYLTTDSLDKADLVAALAPSVHLSPASVALARQKAYRVTIDVAATTYDHGFLPRTCTPPFCTIEGATPPPPPPAATDPVVAGAVAKARTCFEATWDPAVKLRFAAEKALRDTAGGPIDAADRKLALDYVKARHAIAACAMDLQDTSRKLPLTPSDRKVVDDEINDIRSNYSGQTRYALAILIRLLDPDEARFEESIPF